MVESMIERIAQAIMSAPTRNGAFGDFIHEDEARSAAQAVLAAIREPTVVMRLVGGYTQRHGETEEDRYAYSIWRAMIDAALSEENGERDA